MVAVAGTESRSTLSHDKVLVIFGGLLLVMLLAALDSTIVATALPTIVSELGGLAHLSWVVTAYLLAQTIVTPIYGKLGDLYGRRRVLQTAIVIFLFGSALCGLSGSMTQLILFRGIQGLGGGGLMVTTQAIVGDLVTARDRGRYQGVFGAAFGVASVAGPLIGGYFTSNLTWRWIFYINLPVGIVALIVLAATLPAQSKFTRHKIDYTGAALLAACLASIVLVTDLGGTEYPWSSRFIIALIVIAIASLVGFILVERSAEEPILPLRLFRSRVVWVTSAIGLIVGFALIGSVTYLPLFLQVVKGLSPTDSGLQIIPLMGGTLTASIVAGQIVSRTGRYKFFPIIGTAMVSLGLFLISRMRPDTSTFMDSVFMLVLGVGLGFVMQMLIIAVQNAVEYQDLGVATSSAILFRFIGGSLGASVLGGIFALLLNARLATLLPAGSFDFQALSLQLPPGLPAELRSAYVNAFVESLSTTFVVASVIALFGFVLSWLLPERPLRETLAAATEVDIGGDIAQTFAMPVDPESRAHLLRGLAVLADRHVLRRYIQTVVTRAGVQLSPEAAWLLVRIEREKEADVKEIARRGKCSERILRSAVKQLTDPGLIVGANDRYGLTEAGCDVYNKLVEARREHLAELWPEWSPEKREEVAKILRHLARELLPETSVS
jgi:EmrB/QacA subfamily drug resistance transporter